MMKVDPPQMKTSFETWNKQVAGVVREQGKSGFFPQLIATLCDSIKIDYPQVWLYRRNKVPQALYYEISNEERTAQIDAYINGSYQLDPFYLAALINQQSTGVYRLTELSAGGFQQSDYYRSYYAQCDTEDEIVYIIDIDPDASLQISIMRKKTSPRFCDSELKFLRAAEPVIRELTLHHAQLVQLPQKKDQGDDTMPNIEKTISQAFDLFGRSLLTGREKDVLGLTLQGHSTIVSAEKLNISIETLRQHKKKIYNKLDINSQAELFSLFLNSLSCFERAPTKDPLELYMNTPDR